MIAIASTKVINKKILGFEYLRVICAISVVAIHSFDTNIWLGNLSSKFLRFPVPLFLMMSFFLLFRNMASANKPVAFYLKKRCNRLIPAFLAWSIIYLITRFISGSSIFLSTESIAEYLLLGNASLQLYYVPLIIYFALVLIPLIKILHKSSVIINSIILICLITLAATAQVLVLKFNYISDPELNSFIYYLGYNFVYALMGICLAYSLAPREKLTPVNNIIIFLPMALMIAMLSSSYFIFDLSQINYLLSNLLLFLLFYYLTLPENKLISNLARVSFGVYLSHHLFVELLQVVEAKLNWNVNSFHLTLSNFVLGTTISVVFSYILYKIPQTKFLAN